MIWLSQVLTAELPLPSAFQERHLEKPPFSLGANTWALVLLQKLRIVDRSSLGLSFFVFVFSFSFFGSETPLDY